MTEGQITDELADFLSAHCGIDRSLLAPDAPLFTSERLSSFDLLVLLTFIDDHFGVDIDTSALDIDDVDTLARIAGIVATHGA